MTACRVCLALLLEMFDYFTDKSQPLWSRTLDGILVMKDLPFDDLPRELRQEVTQPDAAIDAILQHYQLSVRSDYQRITDADLLTIQAHSLAIFGPLKEMLTRHP